MAGASQEQGSGRADWVAPKARSTSQQALHAVALSSDGMYLAVGGGDRKVHVFDGRSGEYLQGFTGHRCACAWEYLKIMCMEIPNNNVHENTQ